MQEIISKLRKQYPNTVNPMSDETISSLVEGVKNLSWGTKEVKEWANKSKFPIGQYSFLLMDTRSLVFENNKAAIID